MAGEVELSGIVQQLEVPFTFSIDDGVFSGEADFTLRSAEFGIDVPEAMGGGVLDAQIIVVANETDPAEVEITNFEDIPSVSTEFGDGTTEETNEEADPATDESNDQSQSNE